MEFKNLPLFMVSLFCILLLFLLVFTMIENFHYRRMILDKAEDVITTRLDEIDRRFNETSNQGKTAFDTIDRILCDESTSIEETKLLIDQLDTRLRKADDLIELLSCGGSSE